MQIFPKWTNRIPLAIAVAVPVLLTSIVGLVWYYASPWYTDVGYTPKQPVSYSHKRHAGELGIDCLYCHGNAEKTAHANVPATSTCMNCHKFIKTDSPKLEPIRQSFAQDKPIEWVRIHKVPDYAFFNHSAHLNAGVGCVSCHGRVDQMTEVSLSKPLSMSWCLDCHRNPAPHLRPKSLVTQMDYVPTEKDKQEAQLLAAKLNPPQHCSGCHR